MAARKYTWQETLREMKVGIWTHYVASHKNTFGQKHFEKLIIIAILILIFVPCLVFPFMIAFSWSKNISFIIILVWAIFPGISITYAILRRKRIMKKLLSIPMGEENVEVVHLERLEELDFIYETNGIVYQILQEPDGEFCNLLYNWYHNMDVLRNDKLILYVTDARLFAEKFQTDDVNVEIFTKVVGVFCKDLAVKSEEEFTKKAKNGIKLIRLQVPILNNKGENKGNG